MGNFFSDLINPNVKGRGFEEVPLNQIQQDAEKFLADRFKQGAPLQQVAGLSDLEKTAVELASRFVTSPVTPELQEAIDLTRKTATTPVDVTKVPELAALIEQTEEFGQRESNRLAQSIQIRGGAGSTGGRNVLGQQLKSVQSNILATLAPFASTLRQIRENAVGRLGQLGLQKTGEELSKISVGQEVGGMVRGIQDRINAALFNQQLFPFTAQAPIAAGLLNRQAFAFDPGVVTPPTGQSIARIAGSFIGAGGGGAGTAGSGVAANSTQFNRIADIVNAPGTGFLG